MSSLYGIAVDLGTTQIRVSLNELKGQGRLAAISIRNPQLIIGPDILIRLTTARESQENAQQIQSLVLDAIGSTIQKIALQEGVPLHHVTKVSVVGNTAMLALLARKNIDQLLLPDFWRREIDCQPEDTDTWKEAWGLPPSSTVSLHQPVSGFIGSDLLADVMATNLIKQDHPALLIDFGTNSEIALWDGSQLWATSTPGGPAFESSGTRCGTAAEPGAIYRVLREDKNPELRFEVLGGGTAKGFCGSGFVDIIADLLMTGTIKRNGRISESSGKKNVSFPVGTTYLEISLQDVDALQRAKAAIAAGVACLLRKAGLEVNEIKRLCVCGAFGSFLDVENAQAIGILPEVDPKSVELHGDSALCGCELLLREPEPSREKELKGKIRAINMSQVPEYEGTFVENLYLQPMRLKSGAP